MLSELPAGEWAGVEFEQAREAPEKEASVPLG